MPSVNPFRNPGVVNRDRARRREIDPLQETGLEIGPTGPGELDGSTRLNIPDYKDVPGTRAGEQAARDAGIAQARRHMPNLNVHLAPVYNGSQGDTVPDNAGQVRVNQASPGKVPSKSAVNPLTTVANGSVNHYWMRPVRHIEVQNNSAAIINIDVDGQASAGSLQIPAGQLYCLDARCEYIGIYATAVVNINGTATGNIVVRGYD